MIHACQVLNYAEEIFRENEENSGVERNAMNSAAEEIQNTTCTLVCILLVDVLLFCIPSCSNKISVFIISLCTPLQLNDVTDGLLSPCTSNKLKAFCTQVRIYNDISTVVGTLTTSNPVHSDPCPWINDHFEGAVKQFLRHKMDC